MKSSYNRLIQKPRTAQVSKKNSSISSVLYKQIGETLKQYKDSRGQTRRDRLSRNSNNNICNVQNPKSSTQHSKQKQQTKPQQKQQPMPFTPLVNNFLPLKNQQRTHNLLELQQKKSVKNLQSPIVTPTQTPSNSFVTASIPFPIDQPIISHSGPIPTKTTKKSFQYKYIIGKGGFGKVWKVQHLKTRNQYAMKEMLKSLVMTKKSVQSVMNQRLLLSGLNSPFIVNMHYAFQDRDTLFLVLDLLEGGDLRHHITTKKFSETQSKFFISCLILGLQYLHSNKILHRDIKPENLVLDSRGYLRITDLGIARIRKPHNSSDTSGTPGYMSPQVICRCEHSYVSDYYAIGVIAYQLATGKRPYNGYTRVEIREQILAKQAGIKKGELPEDWGQEAVDFINRLLQRKPEMRLGYAGIEELKGHPWIRDVNWKKLASRDIQSPFIPLMKKSDFDQDQQITIQDQQQAEIIEKNSLLLRKQQFQDLFKNYSYEPTQPTYLQKQKSKQHSKQHSKSKQKPSIKADQHKKSGMLELTRRKNSTGSYAYNPQNSHQNNNNGNQVSLKSSHKNLKKTNISTSNSIDITANNINASINGNGNGNGKNGLKTPQMTATYRNGHGQRKNDRSQLSNWNGNANRQSRDNILNVSECNELYGLGQIGRPGKDKDRQKDRPFFKH